MLDRIENYIEERPWLGVTIIVVLPMLVLLVLSLVMSIEPESYLRKLS